MFNKFNKLLKLYRQFSTIQKSSQQSNIARREYLQFSKSQLTEFGDLPQGIIPTDLQYDFPFHLTKLKNGIKVATEQNQSSLASIQVLVNAGTRHETQETSGTAQFLQRLNFRGTSNKSREQVEKELDHFGGNVTAQTGRETTTYTVSFQPQDLDRAVAFLSDILLNSNYNKNQIEAERDEVYRNCLDNAKDQMAATLEAVHYTCYRDHYISQPTHGIRENISNVTEQHVREFHAGNYIAPNFVVAASGNINHEQLVKSVTNHFKNAPTEAPAGYTKPNTEKPYHTPSTLYMRDDEMANLNIGVFFEAPSYGDSDYFAMKLLKTIMGEYRADQYTGHHLNSADRQYSLMHTELGGMPDVTLHKCEYLPYRDTGLFGNYLYGNEVFANQMLYLSQFILTEYASYINPVEITRGKNKLYNNLLQESNTAQAVGEIAGQVAYLGRRVPRSEYAKRISSYNNTLINKVVSKWFWDKELSVVAWGPIHHIMCFAHYNRPIRRSSLGWYGNTLYKVV